MALMVVHFYVRHNFTPWPWCCSFTAAFLLWAPLPSRSTVSVHVVCAECHFPLRGLLTGAKAWAFISIWLHSQRLESFSTCQQFPAHWFPFFEVVNHHFAVVECDLVIFSIPQLSRHSLLFLINAITSWIMFYYVKYNYVCEIIYI